MYHQPLNRVAAVPISRGEAIGRHLPSESFVRLCSALVLCTLPLLAIWLLFQLAWEQFRGAGRQVRLFCEDFAEEFYRR